MLYNRKNEYNELILNEGRYLQNPNFNNIFPSHGLVILVTVLYSKFLVVQ